MLEDNPHFARLLVRIHSLLDCGLTGTLIKLEVEVRWMSWRKLLGMIEPSINGSWVMSGLTCFPFSLATSLTAAQYCPKFEGFCGIRFLNHQSLSPNSKRMKNWDAPISFYPLSQQLGYQFSDPSISGWWFGPCFIFPLWISSSRLTNSIIFQRGRSTTKQYFLPFVGLANQSSNRCLIWWMRAAARCCSRGGEVSKAQQWRRWRCTIQHESWKKLHETSKS